MSQHADSEVYRGKVYPFFSIKYTFLLVVFIFGVGALIGGEQTHNRPTIIS